MHKNGKASSEYEGSYWNVRSNLVETSFFKNEPNTKNHFPHFICWSLWKAGLASDNTITAAIKRFNLLQVYQRLQKLNLCMSHQMTSSLITLVGSEHDKDVQQWRNTILTELDLISEFQVWVLTIAL